MLREALRRFVSAVKGTETLQALKAEIGELNKESINAIKEMAKAQRDSIGELKEMREFKDLINALKENSIGELKEMAKAKGDSIEELKEMAKAQGDSINACLSSLRDEIRALQEGITANGQVLGNLVELSRRSLILGRTESDLVSKRLLSIPQIVELVHRGLEPCDTLTKAQKAIDQSTDMIIEHIVEDDHRGMQKFLDLLARRLAVEGHETKELQRFKNTFVNHNNQWDALNDFKKEVGSKKWVHPFYTKIEMYLEAAHKQALKEHLKSAESLGLVLLIADATGEIRSEIEVDALGPCKDLGKVYFFHAYEFKSSDNDSGEW